MEQELGARGRPPRRAPHRMSPLTWTDGNAKPTMTLVSPSTAPSNARTAGRSPSSPRRARDLGAESAGPAERRGARRAL